MRKLPAKPAGKKREALANTSRSVLIAGADCVLQSYFVAQCMASYDDHIYYLAGPQEGYLTVKLREAAQSLLKQRGLSAKTSREQLEQRFHWVTWDSHCDISLTESLTTACPMSAIWYFLHPTSDVCETAERTIRKLISAAPALGAAEVNYVTPGAAADDLELDVLRLCKEGGLRYRLFRTSFIVGVGPTSLAWRRKDLYHFLASLHELKTEIEEKRLEYFEYNALRCCVTPGARLNLIRADRAIDLMLRIAHRHRAEGQEYHIASPKPVPFSDLCERIGMVYGLSLLAVHKEAELNVIDRLLQSRVRELLTDCAKSQEFSVEDAYAAAQLDTSHGLFDESAQTETFQCVLRDLDVDLSERRRRAADLASSLAKMTIMRNDGALTYLSGGAAGPAILFLNALGQGLFYWYRLMERLARHHRVIIWEPRVAEQFRLRDQAGDLDAILVNEGIKTCYLVAWCTGAKVAVEFYLQRPDAVHSMVFLNSTFKCLGGAKDLETEYESNFEALCRVLDARPVMAASVMKSLQSGAGGEAWTDVDDEDRSALAVAVLSMINPALKRHVLAPFRDEARTLGYVRQSLDFWSHDTGAKASQVEVPVLFIASEYDTVTLPAASATMARRFPNGRYLEIQGATHYCLYDRPQLIANLIDTFFRNANDPSLIEGDVISNT